jgi:D-glycero-beta-D-manno-heptose 1-phosphate adenylyltransferase
MSSARTVPAPDRLTILMVVPTFPPDQCGVGDYTYQLALHLQLAGHRVVVVTTKRDAPPKPPFELRGVIANWHFPDMRTILDVAREVRPHVMHIQYHNEDYDAVEMISALPLCMKETLPETLVVTTLHNTRSFTFAPRLSMGVFLRFSDWLVLTNDADREILLREYPLYAHKYSVVPAAGGLPCPAGVLAKRHEHRRRLRQQLKLGDDVFLLGYFGFINEEKGLETLLHALHALRAARFPVHLLMVGGLHSDREAEVSPYQQGLQALVDTLGLRDAITATGYLAADAASQHLVGLDLAVLPFRDGVTTKRSSFLSVLSHDVPVLSTRGPHLPAALRDGENVALVEVAAEDAATGERLANAVRALAADAARRDCVRAGGRRLFDDIFAWEPIVRAHAEIYHRSRGALRPVEAGAVTAKLKSRAEMQAVAARLREQGKLIVLAGGCFDLLHVGHIRYLRDAKARGDVLVVGLNSDDSVRGLKGPGRPLIDERERAEILSELTFVDYVVIFHEETAEKLLEELRPHFYAKGTDYEGQTVPGTARFLAAGGKMLFVGDEKTRSSSAYLERLDGAGSAP